MRAERCGGEGRSRSVVGQALVPECDRECEPDRDCGSDDYGCYR